MRTIYAMSVYQQCDWHAHPIQIGDNFVYTSDFHFPTNLLKMFYYNNKHEFGSVHSIAPIII